MGAVAAVALASLAAGCGKDDAASGGGEKSIKIMSIGQYQASAFSLPSMEDGAKAAVKAINDAGGINGMDIELITCNDQGDPNVTAKCARKAVSEQVDAVTGSINLYAQSLTPILEAAQIPYIGGLPLNTTDFTSPISFPLDGGNPANFASEGMALVNAGCTSVGIVVDADSSSAQVSGEFLEKGVELSGGTVAKSVGVSVDTPDMSPAVSSLIDAGAECVGFAISAAPGAKFLAAIRQSSKPDMLVATGVATAPMELIKSSKGLYEGVLLTTSSYAASEETTPDFVSQLKAQNPDIEPDNPAALAWSAVQAFAEIAGNIDGDVTASAVLEQAQKTTDLKVETHPEAIDFTQENPAEGYPRLFNTKALVYEVKDDNYALTSDTPLDVQEALG